MGLTRRYVLPAPSPTFNGLQCPTSVSLPYSICCSTIESLQSFILSIHRHLAVLSIWSRIPFGHQPWDIAQAWKNAAHGSVGTLCSRAPPRNFCHQTLRRVGRWRDTFGLGTWVLQGHSGTCGCAPVGTSWGWVWKECTRALLEDG